MKLKKKNEKNEIDEKNEKIEKKNEKLMNFLMKKDAQLTINKRNIFYFHFCID